MSRCGDKSVTLGEDGDCEKGPTVVTRQVIAKREVFAAGRCEYGPSTAAWVRPLSRFRDLLRSRHRRSARRRASGFIASDLRSNMEARTAHRQYPGCQNV